MVKQLKLESCASTQLLLRENTDGYTLVSTRLQTFGRGRHDRSWEHTAEGLAFSFLAPRHPQQTWQSLEVAVLLGTFLHRKLALQVSYKWPNDLYANDKKCGGILLQSHAGQMAIGIGVNLLPNAHWGSLLSAPATLPSDHQHLWPREFAESYLAASPRETPWIRDEWLRHCGHLGKRVRITEGERVYEGVFEGLGAHGEALVAGEKVFNGTLRWD